MTSHDPNDSLFRLPGGIAPKHYDLTFSVHPSRSEFLGVARITLRTIAPTEAHDTLLLHSEGLTFSASDVHLTVDGASDSQCVSLSAHPASETMALTFDGGIPATVGTEFTVTIRYRGPIRQPGQSQGLYCCSTRDPGFLATHLEPTRARMLYPCFDEPCFKATYKLSVDASSAYTVVSNTCVVAEEDLEESDEGEERRRHIFAQTPPLPPYLVGFDVGKFSMVERLSAKRSIICRVVFPSSQPSSSGWFALDLLTKAVDFYDDFFDCQLPLEKIDLVAIEEFESLGMENWGMINMLSDFLLVDEATPLNRRQRIARLVGHEVCHQWWGNWLTLSWWSEAWLKEGMCRLLEYWFVDTVVSPSWGMWNEFLIQVMNPMLETDVLLSRATSRLDACDERPREIQNSFNMVTYAKGAAILRVIVSVLGMPTMQKALRNLLAGKGQGNCTTEDFSCAIRDACAAEGLFDKQAIVDATLRSGMTAGSPYVVTTCDEASQACRFTLHSIPSLLSGAIPIYVQHLIARHGPSAMDLLTPPVHSCFVWSPLDLPPYVSEPFSVPLRVLEVSTAALSSPTSPDRVSASRKVHAHVLRSSDSLLSLSPNTTSHYTSFYVNYGANGMGLCDYDIASWRAVFEMLPILTDEDRTSITLTLLSLNKLLVGRFTCDAADGDRCTLWLEWLMALTKAPHTINSFLWVVITKKLEEILFATQDHYCCGIVGDFVSSVYAPLVQRGVLSLYASEKTVSFQSDLHLCSSTIMRIMELMALSGGACSLLQDEATEVATWAMSHAYPTVSTPQHNAGNNNGQSTADRLSTGSFAGSPVSVSQTADYPLLDGSPMASARLHIPHRGHLELDDANSKEAARIALTYLIQQDGGLQWWGKVAGIIASILSLNTNVISSEMKIEIPTPFDSTQAPLLLEVAIPAFLALEDDRAFEFMAIVLCHFTSLNYSAKKTLFRNNRFLVYLLENCRHAVRHSLLVSLAATGSTLCSNGNVIALLKAALLHPDVPPSAGQQQSRSLEHLQAVKADGDVGHDESELLREYFLSMEANYVLMDYSCGHYDSYLREQHEVRAWTSSRGAHEYRPASTLLSSGVGGISI